MSISSEIDKLKLTQCPVHHLENSAICCHLNCTEPSRLLCSECIHDKHPQKEIKFRKIMEILLETENTHKQQEEIINMEMANIQKLVKNISCITNEILQSIQTYYNNSQEKGIKQFYQLLSDQPSRSQANQFAERFVSCLAFDEDQKKDLIIIEQENILSNVQECQSNFLRIQDDLNRFRKSFKTKSFIKESNLFQSSIISTVTIQPHLYKHIRVADYSQRLNLIAKSGDQFLVSLTKDNDPHCYQELKEGIEDYVRCLKFSPNGYRLAYGMGKCKPQIHVYYFNEHAEKEDKKILQGHQRGVIDLQFYTDNIIISCDSKSLFKWDLTKPQNSEKVGYETFGNSQIAKQLEISRETKLIAIASQKIIDLYDAESLSLQKRITLEGEANVHYIFPLTFSPFGTQIAATWRNLEKDQNKQNKLINMDKKIRIWDVNTGAVIGKDLEIKFGSGSLVSKLRYRQDGKQIIVGCYDGTISLINLENEKKEDEMKLSNRNIISLIEREQDFIFVTNNGEIQKLQRK